MALIFTNNATATLANTLSAGQTTATVNGGEGQAFPSPSGGDTFYATLEDAAGNIEIVSVTARATDTFTVVRAQEGTTDQTWAAGTRFECRVTAATLTAMLQGTDAATTYAPLTHFNDNGVAAEQLHNGNRASITTNQGVNVQRQTGQTESNISLRDDSGTEEGAVLTDTSDNLDVYNKTISGAVRLRATNASGTPVIIASGDPDGQWQGYNAGNIKHTAENWGLSIRGTNNLAPYDAHYRIYTPDGNTLLGAIGFVSTTNEFRVISYADGYPIGLYADNSGGTLVAVATGDPDGAFNAFYANAKKFETSSAGGTITGVLTQTTEPTSAGHVTTKNYVDNAIAALGSSSLVAGTDGYWTDSTGYTKQWGSTVDQTADISVSFNVAFSTVYNVQLTERVSRAGNLEHRHAVTNLTTSGFTIDKENDYQMGYYWEATGTI